MDNFLIFYPIFHLSSFAIKGFLNVVNNTGNKSLTSKIRAKNNEILFLMSALNFNSLYISLTTSNSILYRFKFLDKNYEFKWEIFTEEDECDVQSILHIYRDNTKIKSTYGSIDYIYNLINSIVSNNAIYSSKIEEYSPNIYIKTYEEGYLSSALSPY